MKIESIPECVRVIKFNNNFNKSLDNIGNFVETISLKKNYNQKIDILPANIYCLDMPFLKIENYVFNVPETVMYLSIISTEYNENMTFSKIKFCNEDIRIFIPICFKNVLSDIIIDCDIYIKNIIFVFESDKITSQIVSNNIYTNIINESDSFNKEEIEYIKNSYSLKFENLNINKHKNILLYLKNIRILHCNDENKKRNISNFIRNFCSLDKLFLKLLKSQFTYIPDISYKINMSYLPSVNCIVLNNFPVYNATNIQNTLIKLTLIDQREHIKIRIPYKLEYYSESKQNIIKAFSKNTKVISIVMSKTIKKTKFPSQIDKLVLFEECGITSNKKLYHQDIFKKTFKNSKIKLLITDIQQIATNNPYSQNIDDIILKNNTEMLNSGTNKNVSILNI